MLGVHELNRLEEIETHFQWIDDMHVIYQLDVMGMIAFIDQARDGMCCSENCVHQGQKDTRYTKQRQMQLVADRLLSA